MLSTTVLNPRDPASSHHPPFQVRKLRLSGVQSPTGLTASQLGDPGEVLWPFSISLRVTPPPLLESKTFNAQAGGERGLLTLQPTGPMGASDPHRNRRRMGEAGLGQEGPGSHDRDAEGAGLLSKTALPASLHPAHPGHLQGTVPGIQGPLGRF